MLDLKLTGAILTIIESTHTFNKTDKRFWYYNIETWYKNRNGKEHEPIDLECDQNCINWVKKHYFPKVGL